MAQNKSRVYVKLYDLHVVNYHTYKHAQDIRCTYENGKKKQNNGMQITLT